MEEVGWGVGRAVDSSVFAAVEGGVKCGAGSGIGGGIGVAVFAEAEDNVDGPVPAEEHSQPVHGLLLEPTDKEGAVPVHGQVRLQ